MRQGGGETEMRERKIPVGLDGTTEPRDRILIAAHIEFGEAREIYPDIGVRIARTEAKRLLDMGFGFIAATDETWLDRSLRGRMPNFDPAPKPARIGPKTCWPMPNGTCLGPHVLGPRPTPYQPRGSRHLARTSILGTVRTVLSYLHAAAERLSLDRGQLLVAVY
jgi:hypothetical protein